MPIDTHAAGAAIEGHFPNYAGRSDRDDEIAAELEAAGIKVHRFESLRNQREVKTSVMGELTGWSFRRGWRYWVAEGNGIELAAAERLHAKHPRTVRVEGHCGCPSPREWCKGLAVGSYHVDSPEGLQGLADTIRELTAPATASPAPGALADLRALSEAATPGRWRVYGGGAICDETGDLGSAIATSCGNPSRWPANRAFIVGLVNAYRSGTLLASSPAASAPPVDSGERERIAALEFYAEPDHWSANGPWKLAFESPGRDGNGWDVAKAALARHATPDGEGGLPEPEQPAGHLTSDEDLWGFRAATPQGAGETTDLREALARLIEPSAVRLLENGAAGPRGWAESAVVGAKITAQRIIDGPLAQREAAHAAEIQAREAEIVRLKAERDEALSRNGQLAVALRDEKLRRSMPPSAQLARADAAEARADRLAADIDAVLTEACQMGSILLMAGEMTAQERRTARAVANGIASKVRAALPEAITPKETSDVQN